jgi:hypothetical protein
VLAACSLARATADRVRREGLSVEPSGETRVFEAEGKTLNIPHWTYLGGDLLVAAMTGGASNPEVVAYLDSILEFAAPYGGERLEGLRRARYETGGYPTTEARISEEYAIGENCISEKEGLHLVLYACEELEAQVSRLRRQESQPGETGAS